MAAVPAMLVAQAREPFPGLDAYMNAAMQTWKVPGMSIAIVRNDSVIYTRGLRRAGRGQEQRAVDERTIFAIGSSSKAFTAASIAMLVDEKKVRSTRPATVPARIPARRPVRHARDDGARPAEPPQRARARRTGMVRLGLRSRRDRAARAIPAADVELCGRSSATRTSCTSRRDRSSRRCRGKSWDDFVQERHLRAVRHDVERRRPYAGLEQRRTSHARTPTVRQCGARGRLAQHRQRGPGRLDQLERRGHGAVAPAAARRRDVRRQAADQRDAWSTRCTRRTPSSASTRRRARSIRKRTCRPTGLDGSSGLSRPHGRASRRQRRRHSRRWSR